MFVLKASLAYEKGSDLSSAIESLDKIINDYAKSTQVNEARKQKARLEVLAGR